MIYHGENIIYHGENMIYHGENMIYHGSSFSTSMVDENVSIVTT